MTTVDHSIDYSFAGKGAKARQRKRLTLETIPKKIAKAKPYLQKPEYESRKVKNVKMSEAYQGAMGVKARIRYLVIDHDMSFLDVCDAMKQQGYSLSGVTIGNVRREIMEVMKLLEKEGLLNVDALARRRRKIKAREAV
jgi:hypothetical protein